MSKLIGAKLGETAYLSVTDDGKLQYSLTGAADDFVEFETSGSGGESSGIKFYECKTYTPDADAYTKYSFTMSGAPDADANTTYERTKWVETPDTDSDYTITAQWTAANGYTIVEESGWGEFSYYIKNASGTTVYSTDMPLSARATDYSTIPWMDMDMYESVTLTFSAISTEDVPATTEGWTGVLMQQDTSTGIWSASATDPVNLTVQYLTPRVGEIYSEDTSIRVRKMYDGSLIPIPQDGLVFYAPLQSDYVDVITKASPINTAGSFSTYRGVNCVYLEGITGECINYASHSDLPLNTTLQSLVAMFAITKSDSNWNIVLGLGNTSSELYMGIKDGGVSDMGGDIESGVWYTAVITRNSEGVKTLYVNGALISSGNDTNIIQADASVTIGNILRGGKTFPFGGYLGTQAVYDRELTAEEVLEIHNTLMEGVVQ